MSLSKKSARTTPVVVVDEANASTGAIQRIGQDQALGLVKDVMLHHVDKNYPIRVTRKRLIKSVRSYALDKDGLVALVDTHQEFGAKFSSMEKFLDDDFSPKEVYTIYHAREGALSKLQAGNLSISLELIARFSRVFDEVDPDDPDDVSDQIVSAFEQVSRIFPFVKYVNTALQFLCDVAETQELETIDAAVDYLQTQRMWRDPTSREIIERERRSV